jgi:hypothetical protein
MRCQEAAKAIEAYAAARRTRNAKPVHKPRPRPAWPERPLSLPLTRGMRVVIGLMVLAFLAAVGVALRG